MVVALLCQLHASIEISINGLYDMQQRDLLRILGQGKSAPRTAFAPKDIRADKLLERLNTYINRNRGSITNYAERYQAQNRIVTSPAEASVNALVAKRFVKKQQMRWSRTGAHYLLTVRAAMLNGDLSQEFGVP